MALRGTLTHRKTRRLARALNFPLPCALGIVEALWHVCAEQAPRGDIGRLSNTDIADEMFFPIERADELIAALIESEWIDKCLECRLIVHDWSDHADDYIDVKLARSGKTYADGKIPRMNKLSKEERARLCAQFGWNATEGHKKPQNATECPVVRKPEPVPVPGPVPCKVSEAKASSPRQAGDKASPDSEGKIAPDPEELIYQEYPRKEGHGAALKAIEKAVDRIRKGEGVIPPIPDTREARVYLYKRVQTYARSPAGSRTDKTLIPHPATWFNQSRYLDDESNWQQGGQGGPDQANRSGAVGRVTRTLGEWDRAFAEQDRARAVQAPVQTNAGVLPAPGVRT